MSGKLSEFEREFKRNIKRRREFKLNNCKSLTDVGFDGEYVTPLQIRARSATGPCLVSHYWFNVVDLEKCRSSPEEYQFLKKCGYARKLRFNQIMNHALDEIGIQREDAYMTQAFHLLPLEGQPKAKDIWPSFKAITQHEIRGRKVIALGNPAIKACKEFSRENFESFAFVPSPSSSKPNRVNLLIEAIERTL